MLPYFFFSPRSSKSASTTSPSFGPVGVAWPGAPAAPGWLCAWASRYMISASLCEARVRLSWARFIRSRSSLFNASPASAIASSLALEDVDLDRGLTVGRGRERLALLRRDRRVPRDQGRHHAAEGLDAQRERSDVE